MMPPRGKGDGLLIIAHPATSGSSDSGPRLSPPEGMEPDRDEQGGAQDGDCDDCRFMASDGRCMKFPPLGGVWAQVNPDDWCSFFEPGPTRQVGSGQPQQQQGSQQPSQQPQYGNSGGGGYQRQ